MHTEQAAGETGSIWQMHSEPEWSEQLSEPTEAKFAQISQVFADAVEKQADEAAKTGCHSFYAYYCPFLEKMDYQGYLIDRIRTVLNGRGIHVGHRVADWRAYFEKPHYALKFSRGEPSQTTLEVEATRRATSLLQRFDENLAIEQAKHLRPNHALGATYYGWYFSMPAKGMSWPKSIASAICQDPWHRSRKDGWQYQTSRCFTLDRALLRDQIIDHVRATLRQRYRQEPHTIFQVEAAKLKHEAPDSVALSISVLEAPNGVYKADWQGWEGLEKLASRSYCAACCC